MTRKNRLTQIAAAGTLATGLLLSGCAVHAHPHAGHSHHKHGKVVVVKKGHVHSARCGHYRHQGRWYFVKGHVHGPRCGHAHVRGVWIRKH